MPRRCTLAMRELGCALAGHAAGYLLPWPGVRGLRRHQG